MTVQPSGATARTSLHLLLERRDRRRDDDELGRRDGVGERRGPVDGAPLGRGRERRLVGVDPDDETSPARFAASPTEAPISPVPTTARLEIRHATAPTRTIREHSRVRPRA